VVKEALGGSQKRLNCFKEFAMGDFATELPPEHFDGVEPGTIGRQVEQNQPSSRCTPHCFNLVIFMGIGIIPSHIDSSRWMLIDQGLKEFGNLSAAFATTKQDQTFAGMVVDGAYPIVFRGLSRCADHDLLAHWTPHRPQGRQPAHIELVGVVEHIPFVQAITGFFDRLFLTSYSGSGLLILC